mgnify:CR=1 FL=1
MLLLGLALAMGPDSAFVLHATGGLTASTETGFEPLLRHDPIPLGSTVCTGSDARATLRLATQCSADGLRNDDVFLAPNTCVLLEEAHNDVDGRTTRLRVLQGELMVSENRAGGTIAIRTDAGSTTGRGGGFRVTVEDDGMRSEALHAPVDVEAQGVTVALAAGQGSRTVHGEAPGAPVDLLAPGTPTRPDVDAMLIRADFAWTDVKGALGYRVEFAADPDFTEILWSEDVAGSPWHPAVLMLPWGTSASLHWRLSSFDRLGFLGIPSAGRSLKLPAVSLGD